MLDRITLWLKQVSLKSEINTIKMKLEIPGPLARIPNWRETLLDELRDKEEELMRSES